MDAQSESRREPTDDDFCVAEQVIPHLVSPPAEGTREYDARRHDLARMRAEFGATRFDLLCGLRKPRDLTEQLSAAVCQGKITKDEMLERLRSDAERPIDRAMLEAFCQAYEDRLHTYSDMLRTIVEIATDHRGSESRRRRETEVDQHVERMMAQLPLWQELLRTVAEFLCEQRAETGRGPVKCGNYSHASAHLLAKHVMSDAARFWQHCKESAHRSRTEPGCSYATASALFFKVPMDVLVRPQELLALISLERAAATKALREAQRQPGAARPGTNINTNAEAVHVRTQSVSGPAELLVAEKRQAKRAKAGAEMWRLARKKMLDLLRRDRLPDSLRRAAKAIDQKNDTTRRAARRSHLLAAHFHVPVDEQWAGMRGCSPLDELAKQADRRTQQAIRQMSPRRREEAEAAIQRMEPERRIELLKTLATNPDAGSTGEVSLIENTDQDSQADDWPE